MYVCANIHAISRNSKYMAHETRVIQPCSGVQVRLSGGETGTITNTMQHKYVC